MLCPDRPPADGRGSAVGDPGRCGSLPCFIGQQKDPLGGECGHVLIVDGRGTFQCDSCLHALTGRELQQIRLAVEHQFSGEPVQQNGNLGSVIRWLGIIRQSQCDALAAARSGQVFHGPLDLADIQPVPTQRQTNPQACQQNPAPRVSGEASESPCDYQEECQGGGDLPGNRQKILAKKDPAGECTGEYSKRPHLPAGGVGSSVRPNR